MYWDDRRLWHPRPAPAVSRMKQAMQKPMFLGFPNQTSAAAMIADASAARMILRFSFNANTSKQI